ncbi:MAG: hypothetical protein HOZ81_42855 [Streptomyces sp.]|nr:hypothetical protein [Streptomyces sp.]
MQTTMPRLAAPVTRTITGTCAVEADGLAPSIWGGITWKNIPFAGEDDE